MPDKKNTLYLSIGSNLGQRADNMERAIRLIDERVGQVVSRSAFYETKPVGFTSEHLFLNAAIAVRTALHPLDALGITQQIERDMGRTNKSSQGIYADRIIDIDLLMADDFVFDSDALTLPHKHLHERRFVLEPLCEITPEAVHPLLGKRVGELLTALNMGRIAEVLGTDITPSTVSALNALLAQLTTHARPLTAASLQVIADTPNVHLYVLRTETSDIGGMATLATDTLPTGVKAWIEDVVVDAACRGRGYGRQLVDFLVNEARRLGANSVNLTSKPSRAAANKLYKSAGFVQRETNVYKLAF